MEEAEVKQLISLIESAQLQYEVDETGTVSIVCDPVQLVDVTGIQEADAEANAALSDNNILTQHIQSNITIEEAIKNDGNNIILKSEREDEDGLEEIVEEEIEDPKPHQQNGNEKTNIHSPSGTHSPLQYFVQTEDGEIIQVLESLEDVSNGTSVGGARSLDAITGDGTFTSAPRGNGSDNMEILVVGSCESGEMFLIDTSGKEMTEDNGDSVDSSQVMLKSSEIEGRNDDPLDKPSDLYITTSGASCNVDSEDSLHNTEVAEGKYSNAKSPRFHSNSVCVTTSPVQKRKFTQISCMPANALPSYKRSGKLSSQNESTVLIKDTAPSSSSTLAEGSVVETEKGKMKAFSLSTMSTERVSKKTSIQSIASSFGSWVKVLKPVDQEKDVGISTVKERFPVYPCNDCGTILHSERSLRTHRRRDHEEWDDECFICGEKFLNMHYVRAHIREIHIDEKSFACRHCSFKCSLIKEFFKHFKVHKKSQSCNKCGKKYISPKLFQDHVVNCKTKESPEMKFSNTDIVHQIKLTKDADNKEKAFAFVDEVDNSSNQGKPVKLGQNSKKDSEFKLESKYYSQQIKKLALEPNTRNPGRGRFRTHRCYLCFKCFPSNSDLEAHKEVYHHAKSSQPVRVKTDESLGNEEDDTMAISAKGNEYSCGEDINEEVQIKVEPPELTENMENVTIVLDESMRLMNVIKSLCIACKAYTRTDYRQTCKIFQNISNCDQLETLKNFEKFFPCVISTESLVNPWVLCKNCALLIDKITDMEEKLKSMKNNLLLRLQGNVASATKNDDELNLGGIYVKKEDNEGNCAKAVSNDELFSYTERSLDVEEYMKKNCEIMEIIKPPKKTGRPRKNEIEKLAPVLMSDDVDGLLSSDSTEVPIRKVDDKLTKEGIGIVESNPEKFIIAPIKSEDPEDTPDKLHINQKINIKMEPLHHEAEPDMSGAHSPSWEDLERSSLKSVNSLQDEDFLVTTYKIRKDPELDADLFPSQLLSDEVDFESPHNKQDKSSKNKHCKINVTKEDESALATSCSSENINLSSNEIEIKQDSMDFQPCFRSQEESVFRESKNRNEEETPSKEDIECDMEYDASLEGNPEAKDIKDIPSEWIDTLPKKSRIKKRAKIQEERRLMSYRVEDNTSKPWRCSNCHKGFSTQRGACDHYAASHGGQNFPCEHCKASYVRKRDLIGHYNRVHLKAKPYKCKRCNETFSMHSQLYRHVSTAHMEVKSLNKYSCHLCEATFSQKRYRDAHIMVCSTKGSDHAPHTCPHCDKSFKLVKYLRTHMRSVHSVKSLYFLCEICNKVLNDKRNLILHMKSHSGETETSCKVCHKTFSRKSYLWAHMRVHTDERPYGCNYCPKWFKQYSTWKNHERTHTGEKPYKCIHCSALFSTRSSVSKHVQYAHFQIRDHACSVCQKGFISRAKLADHMKTHTGEKPYECPLCTRAFSRKINLRYHMYTHSDNKRFRCELCGEGFMRRTAIENHILDRHGDVGAMLRANMSDQEKEKVGTEAVVAATAPFITIIGADDIKAEDTYIVVYADEDKEEPFENMQQKSQDEGSGKNLPVNAIQNPASRSFSTNVSDDIIRDDSVIPSFIRAVSEEVATISLQETSQFELHVSEDSSGPVYSV